MEYTTQSCRNLVPQASKAWLSSAPGGSGRLERPPRAVPGPVPAAARNGTYYIP